ncbi:MAG: formylglycine-generating enzyme family protein [Bacteroidia bacterium]|nr:formylglycine-generating enzyme family protein [Bacteroidia bacterium]
MKPILLFFFLTCLFCIEIKAQGYCCNDYKSDIEGLYNDCEYSLALTKLNNMLKYCDQCQGIANSWRSRIQQCLNDANASGCPCRSSGSTDTDGDGILDIDDQCDTQQGPASNYGCPVVEVEQDFCPMVYVQGGTFTMGDLFGDGEADEQPTHSVTLSAFYMGKYEVTVSEFEVFVNETGYKTDAEKEGWSYYWDGDSWKKKNGVYWKHDEEGNLRERSKYNYPVIHVSWNDAEAFCEWMSRKYGKTYSLPTEAQWEYAARSGGKKNKYAWGNGLTATNGANVATKNHYN